MFQSFMRNVAAGQVNPDALFAMVAPIALLIYIFAVLDARNNQSRGQNLDNQIGFKVALSTFALLGLMLSAINLWAFFIVIFQFSFKLILKPLPGVLVGGAIFYAIVQLVLPKTNSDAEPKVFRLTIGAITILAGIVFISFAHQLLSSLVNFSGWASISTQLAGVIVFLPVSLFGVMFLARAMGVDAVADDIQTMAKKVRLPKKTTPSASTPPTPVTPASTPSTPGAASSTPAAPASKPAAPAPQRPAAAPQRPAAPAPQRPGTPAPQRPGAAPQRPATASQPPAPATPSSSGMRRAPHPGSTPPPGTPTKK